MCGNLAHMGQIFKKKNAEKLLAVKAGLNTRRMSSAQDIFWHSALYLMSIYHEELQGMEKCKFATAISMHVQ